MIANIAVWLVSKGVPLKWARPLIYAAGALLALLAVVIVWNVAVDRAVDRQNDRQRAANAEQARKADNAAAEQQRADDARNRAERGELERITDEGPLSDSQRAYLRCVRLQQAARANGQPVPAC